MSSSLPNKQTVVDAIRRIAQEIGRPPSRAEFKAKSGMSEYQILQHFPSWREAVRAAGLEPDSTNLKLDDSELLQDWGELVRKHRHIPTRAQYRREGKYSPNGTGMISGSLPETAPTSTAPQHRHTKLEDRPIYGNPIDFRGLRHEPVNEQGVVFLFGMVAKELGYMVEAVQSGFPDCEAKRQVGPNKWQRVRIEFEFESRNYRDGGHPLDGCDIVVCWRHNWPDWPTGLEVVELESVIKSLAKAED